MPPTDESRVRRLLRNASWLFGASTVASLIGFLQAIVVGRALGVDDYGLLSLVIVFATVVNQLIDIRLWETVTKFVGEHHERGEHGHARAAIRLAYLLDSVTGVVAFAVVLLVAPFASVRFFHRPEAAGLIAVYAVTLLAATVNQTSMAVLRVFDRFRWLGIEQVAFALLRFVALSVVAIRSGVLVDLLWTYVAADLVRGAFLLALGLRAARTELSAPGPSGLRLLRPRLREFLSFTGHNVLVQVLALLARQIDVLILAAFRPDSDVGSYRMARNFSQLLVRLSDPVYQAIYPELVRLREQARRLDEIRRFIARSMARVMLVIVPIGLAIALGAPIIIERTVGPEFLPAAAAVRFMVIGVLVNAALLWARPLALASGRPGVSTVAFAVSAALLVAGSAILVPRLGYLGSAFMYSLTMATAAALTAAGAVRAARSPAGRASHP